MKRLLQFELRKLLHAKSLFICVGIVFVLSMLNVVLYRVMISLSITMSGNVGDIGQVLIPNSAGDWLATCIGSSSFNTVIPIFVVIFVCEDYTQKTIKNVYSQGYTRTQVYFAKSIVVLIAATASFILTLLFNLVIALIAFGSFGDAPSFFILFDQYLVALCYVALVLFTAFAFKKLALPILLLLFAPGAVSIVLSILDLIIKSESFSLGDYWITSFDVSSVMIVSDKRLAEIGIGSAVYAALFTTLGWLVNRKHEI